MRTKNEPSAVLWEPSNSGTEGCHRRGRTVDRALKISVGPICGTQRETKRTRGEPTSPGVAKMSHMETTLPGLYETLIGSCWSSPETGAAFENPDVGQRSAGSGLVCRDPYRSAQSALSALGQSNCAASQPESWAPQRGVKLGRF